MKLCLFLSPLLPFHYHPSVSHIFISEAEYLWTRLEEFRLPCHGRLKLTQFRKMTDVSVEGDVGGSGGGGSPGGGDGGSADSGSDNGGGGGGGVVDETHVKLSPEEKKDGKWPRY